MNFSGRPNHLATPGQPSREFDFQDIDASMHDLNEAYMLVSIGTGATHFQLSRVARSDTFPLSSPPLMQRGLQFQQTSGSFTSTETGRR